MKKTKIQEKEFQNVRAPSFFLIQTANLSKYFILAS